MFDIIIVILVSEAHPESKRSWTSQDDKSSAQKGGTLKMAPVEVEFGRGAEAQGQEIFIHNEVIDPLVVERGRKKSKTFFARESGRSLTMNLEAECTSDDDSGFLRYKIEECKILRPWRFLDGGTLVIPNSGSVSRVVSHPYEDSLKVGFRARHVRPEPEIK